MINQSSYGEDVLILRMTGELNINNLIHTREKIDGSDLHNYHKVVIDLANVSFLDSIGLGYLIVLIRQVRLNEGVVALCSPNNPVRQLLSGVNIEKYIRIFDTLDQAVSEGLG